MLEFGPLVRQWRTARRFTQEQLADDAEISTRHLSFLECGRSRPSREMVLLLASALELPLRDRNTLLAAAGFTPAYTTGSLEGPELAPVMRAVGWLLDLHEPFGAVVVDRAWNLLRANAGARRLLELFPPTDPCAAQNLMLTLVHPGGLRPYIQGWEHLAGHLVERHIQEVAAHPQDEVRRRVLEQVLAQPGVSEVRRSAPESLAPFATVHLRGPVAEVRLFTLLTTLGTPLDVTAEELRIESYYPADSATETLLRALATRD